MAAGSTSTVLNLPVPGSMIHVTPSFAPAIIKGLTIKPENPFQFDFIVGQGDIKLQGQQLKDESMKMIKYFLAALAVPDEDLWVNLSPYEKDRIIPKAFGETEMGRDLLAQDYLLKQLTASLIYPEDELGKKFWSKVYKQAADKFGTTSIPVNTFNKVWIMPAKAVVYEQGNSVYVVENTLKVMLEEDYVALNNNVQTGTAVAKDNSHSAASQIVREIIIPAIEKEVNEGKTFASLRQIYNTMILASWFKENLKQSILGKIYVNKNKTEGVDVDDKNIQQKIYQQYLAAYKKGVYNYIKEEIDPVSKETSPKKYFSGGYAFMTKPTGATTPVSPVTKFRGNPAQIANKLAAAPGDMRVTVNAAMVSAKPQEDTKRENWGKGVMGSWNPKKVILHDDGNITLEGAERSTAKVESYFQGSKDIRLKTRAVNVAEGETLSQLERQFGNQFGALGIDLSKVRVLERSKEAALYRVFGTVHQNPDLIFIREDILSQGDLKQILEAIHYLTLQASGATGQVFDGKLRKLLNQLSAQDRDLWNNYENQMKFGDAKIAEAKRKELSIVDAVRNLAGLGPDGRMIVTRNVHVSADNLPLRPLWLNGQIMLPQRNTMHRVVVSSKNEGNVLAAPIQFGKAQDSFMMTFINKPGALMDKDALLAALRQLLPTNVIIGPVAGLTQMDVYPKGSIIIDENNIEIENLKDGNSRVALQIWYWSDEQGYLDPPAATSIFPLTTMNGSLAEPSKNADVPNLSYLPRPYNVAIHGFGRIGMPVLRNLMLGPNAQSVHVKLIEGNTSLEIQRKLIEYVDDVHGSFLNPAAGDILITGTERDEGGPGYDFIEISFGANPEAKFRTYVLPKNASAKDRGRYFEKAKIDIAVDAEKGKTQAELGKYIDLGAQVAWVTAPGKTDPKTGKAPMVAIIGLEGQQGDLEQVLAQETGSLGSCTTGALAAILEALLRPGSKEEFEGNVSLAKQLERLFTNASPRDIKGYTPGATFAVTGHAATRSNETVQTTKGLSILAGNMVTGESGAGKVLSQAVPEYRENLSVTALRVGIPTGSYVSVQLEIKVKPGEEVTAESINKRLKEAANSYGRGIFAVEDIDSISQVVGRSESGIVVESATQVLNISRTSYVVNLLIAYDNEWGYAARVADAIQISASELYGRFPAAETIFDLMHNKIMEGIVAFDAQGTHVLNKDKVDDEGGVVEYLMSQSTNNPNAEIRTSARRLLREIRSALGIKAMPMTDIEGKLGQEAKVPAYNVENIGTPAIYWGMRQYFKDAQAKNAGVVVINLGQPDEETLLHHLEYADGYAETVIALAEAAAIKEGYRGKFVYYRMNMNVEPNAYERFKAGYLNPYYEKSLRKVLVARFNNQLDDKQREFLAQEPKEELFDQFVDLFSFQLSQLLEQEWPLLSQTQRQEAALLNTKRLMQQAVSVGIFNFQLDLSSMLSVQQKQAMAKLRAQLAGEDLEAALSSFYAPLEATAQELLRYVREELEDGIENRRADFNSGWLKDAIVRGFAGQMETQDLQQLRDGILNFDTFKQKYPKILRSLGVTRFDSPISISFILSDAAMKSFDERINAWARARGITGVSPVLNTTKVSEQLSPDAKATINSLLGSVIARAKKSEAKAVRLKGLMMDFVQGLMFPTKVENVSVQAKLNQMNFRAESSVEFTQEAQAFTAMERAFLAEAFGADGRVKKGMEGRGEEFKSRIISGDLETTYGDIKTLDRVRQLLVSAFGSEINNLLGTAGDPNVQLAKVDLGPVTGRAAEFEETQMARFQEQGGIVTASDKYFHGRGAPTEISQRPTALQAVLDTTALSVAPQPLAESVPQMLERLKGMVKVGEDDVQVLVSRETLTADGGVIDYLADQVDRNRNYDIIESAVWILSKIANHFNVKSASMHDFYRKAGADERTTPSINTRVDIYNTNRNIFAAAKANNVGRFILERAEGEMSYAGNNHRQHMGLAYAAALKVGWEGFLFMRYDHLNLKADQLFSQLGRSKDGMGGLVGDNVRERLSGKSGTTVPQAVVDMKNKMEEAVAAGTYNIDIDPSNTVLNPTLGVIHRIERQMTTDYINVRSQEDEVFARIVQAAGGIKDKEEDETASLRDIRRALINHLEMAGLMSYGQELSQPLSSQTGDRPGLRRGELQGARPEYVEIGAQLKQGYFKNLREKAKQVAAKGYKIPAGKELEEGFLTAADEQHIQKYFARYRSASPNQGFSPTLLETIRQLRDLHIKMHEITFPLTMELLTHARDLEKKYGLTEKNITISVGVEVMHVDNKVHAMHPSSVLAGITLMEQITRASQKEGLAPASHLSLQAGTMHGVGAVGGKPYLAMYAAYGAATDAMGLFKYVLHGASTTAQENFWLFPVFGINDVHLATEFQKIWFKFLAQNNAPLRKAMIKALEILIDDRLAVDAQMQEKLARGAWDSDSGAIRSTIGSNRGKLKNKNIMAEIFADEDFKKQGLSRDDIEVKILAGELPGKYDVKDMVKQLTVMFKDEIRSFDREHQAELNDRLFKLFSFMFKAFNVTGTQEEMAASVGDIRSFQEARIAQPPALRDALAGKTVFYKTAQTAAVSSADSGGGHNDLANEAMSSDPLKKADSAMIRREGGIDLRQGASILQRTGQGTKFTFNTEALEQMNIAGIAPVIVSITPIGGPSIQEEAKLASL